MKFLKMEKEKNVLKIYFEGYETKPIKYDFNEQRLYGVSGKPIQQLASKFKRPYLDDRTYLERYIYDKIESYYQDKQNPDTCNNHIVHCLTRAEQYWDYRDILDAVPYAETIPKGYIKYCKENDYHISNSTMELFEIYQMCKDGFSRTEQAIIIDLLDLRCCSTNFIREFLQTPNKDYIKTMLHIWYKDKRLFNEWRDLVYSIRENPVYLNRYTEYLDPARDAHRNRQTYREWIKAVSSQLLTIQQMRFKNIETIETENLCIKVPTTPAEFADEGKQQSNCVGYNYHESIKRGENIIYFIRRKDNPDKSYVTCRFNTGYNRNAYRTIEMRTHHNGWEVDNEMEVAEMLNKVDTAILNILKASKEE